MIRLLHFADLHLGVETYGRVNPATGLSTRLEDFLGALDEVVEAALRERVDAVLFAGDAYKNRDPSATHQREFAKRLRRLVEARIPTVLLVGNHDLPNAVNRATSVEVFDAIGVEHVHVARRIGTLTLATRSGPLQIVALPWVTRSALFNREEHKHRTIEDLDKELVERVAESLAGRIAELDPSVPAVLLGHVHVFGARLGSEQSFLMGRGPVFSVSALAHPQIDYVALGHIHHHQVVSPGPPPVVYAGSLSAVDFSEEGQEKGFVLAEVERGRCAWRFVPVTSRPFLTIAVDARGDDDPTESVLRAIERQRARLPGAIVRVAVRLEQEQQARLDEEKVRRALADAAFVASIAREVQRDARTQVGPRSLAGLTPLDVLQQYLEANRVPAERRDELIEHARRLMDAEMVEAAP